MKSKIKIHFWSLPAWIFLMTLTFPAQVFSQDSTETKEKAKAKIKVEYLKNEANVKTIKVTVTSKVEKKWQPVENLSVSFYRDSVSLASLIKKITTDGKGIGTVELADKFGKADSLGMMKVVVTVDPNNDYEEAEEGLEVKDLAVKVNLAEVDSVKTVKVNVGEPVASGETTPLAEMEVKVYVKRMFSLLKVGEGTTDESGNMEVEFPNDIPGGADGMVEIIARVEDNEIYGTVAATTGSVKAGVLVEYQTRQGVRALWSPNAPLWMVITFGILMTGVWGHFIFIIYSLVRISKSGGQTSVQGIIWD